MLKSRVFQLAGRDEGRELLLTELPALAADRLARYALHRIDTDLSSGVVALAMRDQAKVAALGDEGSRLLMPFVCARELDGTPFNWNSLHDWRNVSRIQQAALLLHVDFLVGRDLLDAPVTMRAEQILAGVADTSVAFCSPFIAAVLQSEKATYVELETVLSTEDAFNLVELLNVDAIREWQASQTPKQG